MSVAVLTGPDLVARLHTHHLLNPPLLLVEGDRRWRIGASKHGPMLRVEAVGSGPRRLRIGDAARVEAALEARMTLDLEDEATVTALLEAAHTGRYGVVPGTAARPNPPRVRIQLLGERGAGWTVRVRNGEPWPDPVPASLDFQQAVCHLVAIGLRYHARRMNARRNEPRFQW